MSAWLSSNRVMRNRQFVLISSGSRGKASLELFDAVLVVPLEAAVQLDDVLILEGQKLKVSSVHRRWGLRGRPRAS